jgi:3-hydroxyacyl-[acyl-carrier-protein] dehydratase
MEMDIHEILEHLPHRYPFLLVDRVLAVEPGKSIHAYKNITMNEPYFVGHFPHHPVMPGVLIMEALAQTGAVLLLSQEAYKGKIAYFAGMENVRFKQPVIPGDVLTLEVTLVKQRGPVGFASAKASVRGNLVASGELIFKVGT